MKQQTEENNIDRTSLYVVIIVAQPCQQVVTVLLMVEQCYYITALLSIRLNNLVHGVQHNIVRAY